MDLHKLPDISIVPRDLSRLDLLTGFTSRYRTPAKEILARELRRARIVPSHEVPLGLVTMHSTVRYREGPEGATRIARLVYPGEEDNSDRTISVLTPLGSALIGLSAGQSFEFEDVDGKEKTITVLDVLLQPGCADGGG